VTVSAAEKNVPRVARLAELIGTAAVPSGHFGFQTSSIARNQNLVSSASGFLQMLISSNNAGPNRIAREKWFRPGATFFPERRNVNRRLTENSDLVWLEAIKGCLPYQTMDSSGLSLELLA